MALPLRFCCFFSPRHSQPKIRLAKFSVSSIKAKRKISGFFSKELPAVMAIPNNKLFVWRQHDLAQTSCSAKTNERFLQFALELTSTDGKESKRVYLKRPYDDTFLDFKNRLQQKVWDFLKELSKDKTSIIVQPIFSDGHSPEAVDDVGLFKLFFNTDEPNRQCSTLRIDQTNYEVVRDPAWLDKVEISLLPLVGCPILPSCDWKYTTDNVRFHWYIAHERLQLKISLVNGQSFADRIRLEPSEWVHVHTGPYYSPTMDHFGKFLAVIVDFDNDGIVVGTVCPTPIASAEHKNELLEDKEELIFERRQKECGTKQLSGDSYRLISYNILANLYLNLKKLEQKDLFFPYCPKRFLEANYRYPLLLRELEGYNADLMFLQEVDFRLQKRFLVPFLHTKNYSAAFNCKGNEVNEGLLIAFHNDRFHAMGEGEEDNFTVKLSQFLAKDPANSDIRSYLAYRERLHKTISTRPTILQLIRLRAKHGGRDMLCANTHLYFDPAHEEVKIIQSLLCLRYIEKICARLSKDATEEQIQVIFAGDLNSTPDSRVVALIGGDQIHLEMKRDNQKDEMPGNDPMKIQSSFKYKLLSGSPAYTNFTRPDGYSKGFNGCLDYIWAYPPLRIEHIWPMPDHLLVTKYGALPSPIAPSDHLPILCDVRMDRGVKESEDDEQLLK